MAYETLENGFKLTDINVVPRGIETGRFKVKVYSGEELIEELIPIARLGERYEVSLGEHILGSGILKYSSVDHEFVLSTPGLSNAGLNLTPKIGGLLRNPTGIIDLIFENI